MGNFFSDLTDQVLGKAPSVENQPQASRYTPEQQELLKKLATYYGGYAGDTAIPSYGGDRVAPLSSIFNMAEKNLTNYSPFLSGITPQVTGALTDSLNTTPDYMRSAYETGIANPMIKNWQEEIMPTISGNYAKKGLLYGTGREVAQEKSASDLATALGIGRANLESNIAQNRIGTINAASNFGSQSLAEILGLTSAMTGVGGIKQANEQAGLDVGYQDWLRSQPGSRPQDSVLMAILGLSPMYDQNTVVDPGVNGALWEILGQGAKAGASALVKP